MTDERFGTFSRDDTVNGWLGEWSAFGGLLRSLSPEEWRAPTRCEGWEVRDVASHVVVLAADVATGQPTRATPDEQAAQWRDRSAAELADELGNAIATLRPVAAAIDDEAWEGPSPAPPLTMRQAVEALWFGYYVHGDDIRAAVGRPTERGPGLRMAILHVAEVLASRGWGPAVLALDGMADVPVGSGGDLRVQGDPHLFLMVATGRADPAELGLDETVNIFA
ncbi:MAG TPA: maleylpyruvate isomerase family mycothiol-dependent enzyme [Acidimicrobiales bacterium]